jgi:hypothetical protein
LKQKMAGPAGSRSRSSSRSRTHDRARTETTALAIQYRIVRRIGLMSGPGSERRGRAEAVT